MIFKKIFFAHTVSSHLQLGHKIQKYDLRIATSTNTMAGSSHEVFLFSAKVPKLVVLHL